MKSPMLPAEHHKAVQRTLFLGRNGNPASLPELIELSKLPSNEVRRLAASAIGKLAEFGADPKTAVAAVAKIALHDQHAQTQQYAINALKKYGVAAQMHVPDLRDIANNPANKNYIRSAAKTAADTIELAAKDKTAGGKHRCQRCSAELTAEEHAVSQDAFQRNFCSRCFDETFLARRNFETQVEINKTVEARDGTLVQSQGEKDIAEWLTVHNLAYHYDNKYRIINEFQIRPDFYLPELDLYIEYWGMDTPKYKMSMYKKKILYQQQGKRLISIYPKDRPVLGELLATKLRMFGFTV